MEEMRLRAGGAALGPVLLVKELQAEPATGSRLHGFGPKTEGTSGRQKGALKPARGPASFSISSHYSCLHRKKFWLCLFCTTCFSPVLFSTKSSDIAKEQTYTES